MDPLYGYGAVNVEAQSRDPHSLLNWMRRMLAVRSRHPAFGRGTLTFLYPKNRKILAYLREYEGETLLCVANVAHSPQAVELDLSQFVGRVPVELNAGTPFPPIGELTYLLTLPPYGFYWFALGNDERLAVLAYAGARAATGIRDPGHSRQLGEGACDVRRETLIESEALPQYIAKRRWFGLKDQTIESTRIAHLIDIGERRREILLAEIEVKTKRRQRPLAAAAWRCFGRTNRRRRCPTGSPWRACGAAGASACSTDAFALPGFARRFVQALASGAGVRIRPTARCAFGRHAAGARDALETRPDAEVNWLAAEQSNSSLTIGDAADAEDLSPHIARRASRSRDGPLSNRPRLCPCAATSWRRRSDRSRRNAATLAIALGFIRNQGDAWSWTLDHLSRALDQTRYRRAD